MFQPIASIDALRAYLGDAPMLYLTGYRTICDGGEGPFICDIGDTISADNGGTVIIDGCNRRWRRATEGRQYSVRWFGAKGIGADDTAAILAADLAAAATAAGIWFPGGRYGFNNTSPTFQGNNWTGAGKNVSIVQALPLTYPNGSALANIASKDGFRVTGMGFDFSAGTFPPGSGNPGNVITMFNLVVCNKWSIDHCSFTGIQPHTGGIEANGGSHFKITDNDFEMPVPTGAAWNQAANISNSAGTVIDWTFSGNTLLGTGMFSEGSYGMIGGNYCAGYAYGAGLASGPDARCVSNKYIANTTISGVGLDANNSYVNGIENWSYNAVIVANVSNDNSGHGIGNGGGQSVIGLNITNQNGRTPGSEAGGLNSVSIPGFAGSEGIVIGNISQDFQATPTQAYGYQENDNAGAMIRNTLVGNNFNGNLHGTMLAASGEMSFQGPQLAGAYGPITPGGVTNGTPVPVTFHVPGARMADVVSAAFSNNLNATELSSYVAATDTVVCLFSNPGGGTVFLPAGYVYLTVAKPIGYLKLS